MHLSIPEASSPIKQSILRDPQFELRMPPSAPAATSTFPSLSNSTSTGLSNSYGTKGFKPADKTLIHQWTLRQFQENSLNPTVTAIEEDEYTRYIEHPLNLPLVVSNEIPSADDPGALDYYEYLDMSDIGAQKDTEAQPMRPATTTGFHRDIDVESIRSFSTFPRPTSSAGYPFTPFSHPSSHPHQHPPIPSHYSLYQHQHPHYPLHQDYPVEQPAAVGKFATAEEDIDEFEEFLKVSDNPLDVEDEDGAKKRYKAYRQWLRGKSFFKQSKVDPEWQNQLPVR
jgi:hypothetical protein